MLGSVAAAWLAVTIGLWDTTSLPGEADMRILFYQPRRSRQSDSDSTLAMWIDAVRPNSNHTVIPLKSQPISLLPLSFNVGFAVARNMYEAGEAEAFAMCHTDVVPRDLYCISVMIEKMELVKADLLSVVLAMKNRRRMTSTAVEIDQWNSRQLSLDEVHYGLPDPFTSEDAERVFGKSLLLNTGLWICKLGDWCLQARFDDSNDIIRGEDGKWVPVAVGEDYHFSRQCRKLGLRLAATRSVVADHYDGDTPYSNQIVDWELNHACS